MMVAIRLFMILGMFCMGSGTIAQELYPRTICRLPDVLKESSGIEIRSKNRIYSHNDSGDQPLIYVMDTLGNLLQTIRLLHITASDFEDIARDEFGNLYLGDFGNNFNNRTNLKVYKIPPPESLSGDSIEPEIIYFSYPDQHAFPPDSSQMNFDCESMFYFRDSLYLFSKNRGVSTWCKQYALPCLPGTYVAVLKDSFNTQHWITSADINPNGSAMVLLSESRIWLFTGFGGNQFFDGESSQFHIPATQKEAIVFCSHNEVYITDERWGDQNGNLYQIGLQDYIQGLKFFETIFTIQPNPVLDYFILKSNLPVASDIRIEIYTSGGQKVQESNLTLAAGSTDTRIDFPNFSNGIYFVEIGVDGQGIKCIKIEKL